jgi:hypothetical protein
MARWRDLMEAEPHFCERVAALFDARRHKTLATLRKDGAETPVLRCIAHRMTLLRATRPVGRETRKSQGELSRCRALRSLKRPQTGFGSILKKS